MLLIIYPQTLAATTAAPSPDVPTSDDPMTDAKTTLVPTTIVRTTAAETSPIPTTTGPGTNIMIYFIDHSPRLKSKEIKQGYKIIKAASDLFRFGCSYYYA